jgi:glycosyltransferase 2 family protein
MAALTRSGNLARAPAGQAEVLVEDHLEPRVRIPADLLRCVIAGTEIAVLVGLALLAGATATGLDFDVVRAGGRLPGDLLRLIGIAGSLALWILPLALAVRLAMLRQFRRLAEAAATGGITVGAVALLNLLLTLPALSHLHSALNTTAPHIHGASHVATLDGPLAGLVGYATFIGLRGHVHWRPAFLTAVGFYGLAILTASHATVLSLLITVLTGSAIGSGLRYALGTISGRPTAAEIAAALSNEHERVVAISRTGNGASEVRRYTALTRGGERLDVTVLDRDQQAADAFYRLYRRLRLKADVSRSAPLSLEGAVERQALLIYAMQDAGVRTPRLHAAIRVGPDAAALATRHMEGRTLAQAGSDVTDDQLRRAWDTVLRLHGHRVTHRALTADRILLVPNGPDSDVALLDPGNGDVAASDLQCRLDLAQLIAQTTLLVGADRAADIAIEKVHRTELPSLVPLLQPVALFRSTRAALRGKKNLLATVRKRLLAAAPDGEVPPVQIERIRPRTLITLIAGVFAAYLLAGQLADVHFGTLFARAKPGWTIIALALSALTYVGATTALSGFVLERLNPVRTFLVQIAASFVILVTPAAVGGAALNLRYLRRAKLSATDAAASVGVTQVISLVVYFVLLLVFAAITGTTHAVALPGWTFIALGILAGLVLIVLALPAGRRQLLSTVASAAGQVVPRLLDVAQRPVKLAQGVGGALVVTLAYILCLVASVQALGGAAPPLASIAVVYLTGSAVGSLVPTPGGIGAVEAAMSTGLIAVGMQSSKAVAAVLLFRTVTFWLPVPTGWWAMHFLQRRDVL